MSNRWNLARTATSAFKAYAPPPSAVPGATSVVSGVSSAARGRVSVDGKFFRLGNRKWHLHGLTYGPFAPNSAGEPFPEPGQLQRDFSQIRSFGANCIRLYHIPPVSLLDAALEHDLRVFVDVPWEKHRCFFEDWSSLRGAHDAVRKAATELGNHPGLFALSVVNELPTDVARFYGRKRVGRFVDELINTAKQAAPELLTTFANYPSTEFLQATRADFTCFNVYLDKPDVLGSYLDRLQHLAGNGPLILGEYGTDSIRHGERAQADAVSEHVNRVFRHGLAGSFVFAYTDDWFTGGHQVDDWAFGITRRDRSEKPAARALQAAWAAGPHGAAVASDKPRPKVSVVVCSYNGAATLRECLSSLRNLNYPDYEVILVDDGSTDGTQRIARNFPSVLTIRQENQGLSVARNVGARAATGEIVAYTDSDCVVDPDWLHYLVDAMLRQDVPAIGGPNIPPPSDLWTAQCVAASPGGPSHVMLDDLKAEHVPGCNMAFRRSVLLGIGGFDAQFRQAGDDVDICWRLLDAGHTIGFAPAAFVWHHRRNTVRAYLKQQKGYGRSEAMLLFKHPHRFNQLGCSRWKGVIYGEGAVGLPVVRPRVFHGAYGSALFQKIYTDNDYSAWAYFTLLEWHGLAAALLVAAACLSPWFALASAAMWVLTLLAAARSSSASPMPSTAPLWCRPLVFGLHLAQPVVRAWHRYAYRFLNKGLARGGVENKGDAIEWHRVRATSRDAYWTSDRGHGREELLQGIEAEVTEQRWRGVFHEEWQSWDMKLLGDHWHNIVLYTATEQLGGPKRFTRARCMLSPTRLNKAISILTLMTATAAIIHDPRSLALPSLAIVAIWAIHLLFSRRRCFQAVATLLGSAGRRANLVPYTANTMTHPDNTTKFSSPQVNVEPLPNLANVTDAHSARAHCPAFTLVELLVVIGIIALLIGILMPALSKARDSANKTKCLANLRSIGQGMYLYAHDFRDRLPNTNPPGVSDQAAATVEIDYVLVKFREVYVKGDGVFHCPSDKDEQQTAITNAVIGFANSARLSYDMYSPYWVPERGPKLARLRMAPLAWDLKGADPNPNEYQNHGLAKGGNVVFADGHAEWQPAKEWDGWNWPNPATAQYQ